LHDNFSEFFRPDHPHEQINEEQERDDSDNDRFHVVLLQRLAEAGVKTGHDKKHNDGRDKDEVAHRSSFGFSQKRE
jgi:hypothetical protein